MIYSFHWEKDNDIEYLCSNLSKFYYIASISKDKDCKEYISDIYLSGNKTLTLKDSNLNLLKIKTKVEYINLAEFIFCSNFKNFSYKEMYNQSLF